MIFRTPPQKRRVGDADAIFDERPVSERPLVIYEDPAPVASHEPVSTSDHMLCTYQCRQMVKAEFFDALDSAEKQLRDCQSRLEATNENHCKTEAEKKKFKDQFHFAEQELAATKGREQALQEQLLKEVNGSQERYQMVLKRVSELEVQLKKELDLRRKAECSSAAAEDNFKELKEKLRRVSDSAEMEKNHLRKELLHIENESKLSVSRISANLERMACRANNAERESELLKTQLEDLREQLQESLHQKSELECKLSTLAVPSGAGGSSETDILVKHLREELRNLEAEVREARKWKSSYSSSELLKEKLLEEERRRERAEKELSEMQAVQQNMKNLEDELMLWRSLLKEIPEVSSHDDIPRKFTRLQKEVIDSMKKLGDVNARLKQLEVTLETAELAKRHAEEEGVLAKGKAEELLIEVKRLELMLSSANEERERLRKEVIAWKKTGEPECGKTNESLVKELELSLAEKEFSIGELERNLHEQREVITRQHGELKLLNEKLNNEARRIKSLEREGDRLRSEICLLESKLGHGDYSAANTKVLRMVNTLAFDNEAKHTIEALQAELQKTKAKLQAVEDLKGQSGAGNIVDSQIPEKLAQLKAQIATLEKREERYKSVFAEKISVFRRACCSLFGYKIVMDDQQRPNGIPVTRFTLQSIYAQSDDEKLEFEYESGNTNILANEYTSQPEISQQVEIFIQKMNSIPAFTANLTVESFNKQTLS